MIFELWWPMQFLISGPGTTNWHWMHRQIIVVERTGPNWGQGGVSRKRWCTAIWLAIQTVVINFTTSGLSFRGRRSTSSGTNHAIPCPPSSSSAQEAEAEEEESLHRVSAAAVGSAKWNCFVQFHSKSKPHPRNCSFQGSSSSSSAQ